MIDFRSDTVTRPTPAMRRAMAEAEVGDDFFGEDPTMNKLQERCAELTGHEAALFMPTGSMGNEVAINIHTMPGNEVIMEEDSHPNNYELSGMATFSGVLARAIPSEHGWITAEQIQSSMRPKAYYLPRPTLVVLENTHNMKGGTIYPQPEAERIIHWARSEKIPVHLDGARIFNAAVALDKPVKELTRNFDSVMFTFSKGLGAPVGSMLAGKSEFIEKARIARKRLGGGMRQTGILAAACLYALDHHVERLAEDHANAKKLASALANLDGVRVTPPETNIIIFELTQMPAPEFIKRLKEENILAVIISQSKARMVTHLDVSVRDVEYSIKAIQKIFQ
ncbi:aminotransferase class I/II-fold pyridoxal phosphate-dependent enzyme [Candidatus Acetothermia bacterium]|nr:aminotransferase class I/II-fold pyridoxal phosphate-dependent enzyme [Candidatus Acetothermia bacterium]MBI3643115.1 aminotransferase class I/II-fold pyridoxal phosphate-dependent enzyme [Candidatus Acetothermia bacterium]